MNIGGALGKVRVYFHGHGRACHDMTWHMEGRNCSDESHQPGWLLGCYFSCLGCVGFPRLVSRLASPRF
jgi:hypothetical protein